MIKIENTEVFGWEAAIRGMRNPMNSWDKSDSWQSDFTDDGNGGFVVGTNDLKLMKNLVKTGTDHSKFMRMINVTCDITAPLYWWKEFDTYKVGTVRNSCSTMHKIHSKEFTLDNFSHEHLSWSGTDTLKSIIAKLNYYRDLYRRLDDDSMLSRDTVKTKKDAWWQIIQLLPSSYNQQATVQLNYQVLRNMYHSRKNHKLDEWHNFCYWIESLPYAKELICDG